MKKTIQQSVGGFTLIESLVVLFIFALISTVFLQTYVVGSQMIIESKNRLGATALANQKMEIIRSIAYDAIGTTTGVPSGSLAEDEVISVNTTRYNVHTYVQYKDDPFDGLLGGSPNDSVPNDYKRVRLTVTWGNAGQNQTVVLFGNFSPNGIETPVSGGILSINILNSSGSGVSGATVHVQDAAKGVSFTTTTDSTGNVTTVGAPADTRGYVLTISKAGYYGAQTYLPTATYNPVDINASVVNATLNQITMVMDQSADIHLKTEDSFGAAVPNTSVTVTGGRILGLDSTLTPAKTVFGFTQATNTDSSGEKIFSDQSYGAYTVSGVSKSGYTFYKMSPDSAAANLFDVVPGVDKNASVLLVNNAFGSLWLKVASQSDTAPIAGASIHLTDAVSGYDATVVADAFGYAYFPTTSTELVTGVYTMEVSATGFQTNSSMISISAGARTDKDIKLIPN